MKLTRIPHLDGDPGVAQTIRQMRRLIQQGKKDPSIHETAARILRAANVRSFDWHGEARAIFEAVRSNLRFTRDVTGHETLHAAADIMRLGIADCDDFTILICSLMGTIGADCRIVTIATDPDGEFCHVYPEAQIDGRWIAMDAARLAPAFGKSPENYTRKRVWAVDSEEFADMRGMRGLGEGRTNIAPGQGPIGAWRANVYPPFRLAISKMMGSYLSAQPVAPRHQQFKRPPLGHGNYGPAAARRALEDFSPHDRRRALGQSDGTVLQDPNGNVLDTSTGTWYDTSGNPMAPPSMPGTMNQVYPSAGASSGMTPAQITSLLTAAQTGIANIITASRASPYNLVPTTSMTAAARAPSTLLPATANIFTSLTSSPLLIGALLLGGLLLAEGRR